MSQNKKRKRPVSPAPCTAELNKRMTIGSKYCVLAAVLRGSVRARILGSMLSWRRTPSHPTFHAPASPTSPTPPLTPPATAPPIVPTHPALLPGGWAHSAATTALAELHEPLLASHAANHPDASNSPLTAPGGSRVAVGGGVSYGVGLEVVTASVQGAISMQGWQAGSESALGSLSGSVAGPLGEGGGAEGGVRHNTTPQNGGQSRGEVGGEGEEEEGEQGQGEASPLLPGRQV
ncbi:hypothetical protein QJQ45_024687 [Haematococcus lacustris]|nr:hypothetical protein QJQ45_024687 [Haematococcus lacustris]